MAVLHASGPGWSLTVLSWAATLRWSLIIFSGFSLMQLFETFVLSLPRDSRLVRDAAELATRVVGFSHHSVALFFMLTGSALRRPAGWGLAVGYGALGVTISLIFGALGGRANAACLLGFYIGFLAHSFHDERYFHRMLTSARGAVVDARDTTSRWIVVGSVAALGTTVIPVYFYIAHRGHGSDGFAWLPFVHARVGKSQMRAMRAMLPGEWSFLEIFALFGLPCLALLVFALVRLAKDRGGPDALRAAMPLVAVLGGSVALVLASILFGTWTLSLVILMHFVAWYRFTVARLEAGSGAAPLSATWIAWFRGTVGGFRLLHVGLAGVFLGLIAFDHYADPHVPGVPFSTRTLLRWLSRDAFYYWTIVHVTLSLVPRGKILTASPSPPAIA